MHKYIDLTVEAYEEYLKISFSVEGVLLNSIMDIHGSAAEGRADPNWMTVDVRGGAVKIFHSVEVIDEWPLDGRIIETCVRIWSFWICALYVSKLS